MPPRQDDEIAHKPFKARLEQLQVVASLCQDDGESSGLECLQYVIEN